MKSLNRVMLIGHLAADPEARQTKSGISVVNFPIATNHLTKDENGEKKEIVDFHRIVAWGKLADVCEEYLCKGMAVYVEGRLINRSYEDKDKNRHYMTEIVIHDLNILTWKKSKSGKEELNIEKLPEGEEEVVEA